MEATLTFDTQDIFTRELSKINAQELVPAESTGRPLFNGKDSKSIVAKLAYAFSVGSTVIEACAFAGISRDSYYRCTNKYPEFRNRLEQFQHIPVIQARINVAKAIMSGDLKMSMWYLESRWGSDTQIIKKVWCSESR